MHKMDQGGAQVLEDAVQSGADFRDAGCSSWGRRWGRHACCWLCALSLWLTTKPALNAPFAFCPFFVEAKVPYGFLSVARNRLLIQASGKSQGP